MMQIMDSGLFASCLIIFFATFRGSYGDDESAKIFGFLRSGEKCLEQSNPDVCLKKKLLAHCEKNNEGVLEGKPISKICQCTEDDSRLKYSQVQSYTCTLSVIFFKGILLQHRDVTIKLFFSMEIAQFTPQPVMGEKRSCSICCRYDMYWFRVEENDWPDRKVSITYNMHWWQQRHISVDPRAA